MRTSNLEYTSFLVRLWREAPDSIEPPAADREWVVQVEHIPSGEHAYFASLEDLFAFIREQAAGPPAGKGAGGQGGGGARGQDGRVAQDDRRTTTDER